MPAEQSLLEILQAHSTLFFIASVGGLVLFGLKTAEHFNRAPENKLSWGRYTIWFVFLLLVLPSLGTMVLLIYLANGDKISPVLAFQVGLTSPAIVQSMIIAAANNLQRQPLQTVAAQ
jgi:hypothetical protein